MIPREKEDPGSRSALPGPEAAGDGRQDPPGTRARRRALKIAGIYGACGLLWITLSDRVLASLITDSAMLSQFQTYKGWFFICFTALLVFFLTRRALQQPEHLAERIRSSETRYRALFESLDAAVLLMRGPVCIDCNTTALKLFGLSAKDEIIGKTPLDFAPPRQPDGRDSAETVRWNIEMALQKGTHIFDWQAFRKDGAPFIMEVRFTPYRVGEELFFQCIALDITERKQAEKALQNSEAKFRRLYNETPIMLHSIDRNAVVVDVNDHWLKTMGYTRDEVIGRTVNDFYTEASRKYAIETVQPAFFRDGVAKEIAYQFVKKNGEVIDVVVSATAERDAAGNVIRSQAVIEDVTARKRTEAELRESRLMFQTIIDAEPECVKILDENANVILMNRAGLDMIQAGSLGEIKGTCVCPIVTSEYRPAFMELTRRVFRGESGKLLFEMEGLKGRRRWLETHAVPLRNERNEVSALLGVSRDVTERKQAEDALRNSEQRYRLLFESANDGIFIHDESGFIDCNRRGAEMYGLSREQVIGRSPTDLAPVLQPDGRPSATVAGERIVPAMKGIPQTFDWQALRADGSRIDVEVNLSRFELSGRLCLQAIVRDISDRKKAEQEIAERSARLRQIIDTADASIFLLDLSGRVTLANKRMAEMFNSTMVDLIGSDYLDYIPVSEREERRPHFMAMLTGKIASVDFERLFLRKDGTEFWGHMAGKQLLDPAGAILGLIGVVTDITKRKEAEAALQQSQKLESISTLAGGIAHDFNNLLQGVFGYVSMAKLSIDRKDKALEMLDQAEKALHASVNLSNQLLTFSKGGKPVKSLLSLEPLLRNWVKFTLSGSKADYRIQCPQDLWMVEADEGQIAQVIQNIVLNADQSMQRGGIVTITARNAQVSPGNRSLSVPDGNYVEIDVEDSGTGIPEEIRAKIFDPYFTTKENGTGLGLATSYAIVRNHGGAIKVTSEVGKGSIFSIYLPSLRATANAAPVPQKTPCCAKSRILLMDDDAVIREIGREMLQVDGHEVAFAENGQEAIARFVAARSAGAPFDIVILDLTIRGGMGGKETIRRLLEIDPGVRAIVSSGYSDDTVIADHRAFGFAACLAKPYELEKLRRVIHDLLT